MCESIRKRAHTQLAREHSSQLTEPLWTDPGIKTGSSVRELISTLKKRKKEKKEAQAGNKYSNILPKSSQARKKLPPPPYSSICATNTMCRYGLAFHSSCKSCGQSQRAYQGEDGSSAIQPKSDSLFMTRRSVFEDLWEEMKLREREIVIATERRQRAFNCLNLMAFNFNFFCLMLQLHDSQHSGRCMQQ